MASIVRVTDQTGVEIDRLVASGRYASRDAVVAEGVRRLGEEQEWLRMVDAKVAAGLADIDAGRVTPLAEVREQMKAYLAAKR